jgi:hypothetical protein
MTIFVSASHKGFYDDSVHESRPADAVPIDRDAYLELIAGQGSGKKIDFSVFPPVCIEVPVVYPTAAELSARIDAQVAEIYSNWTRFEAEYVFREAAAIKYRDAGYTGEAGVWISAFATAAGLDLRAACDLILLQSANLRAAQETLGALRMRKYELVPLSGVALQTRFDEISTNIRLVSYQIK